eukprot:5105157-Amphidinium_carterae.1
MSKYQDSTPSVTYVYSDTLTSKSTSWICLVCVCVEMAQVRYDSEQYELSEMVSQFKAHDFLAMTTTQPVHGWID